MTLWESNLVVFKAKMRAKIEGNMKEKGLSWREPSEGTARYLKRKVSEYSDSEDWVSVANLAFMLWERKYGK